RYGEGDVARFMNSPQHDVLWVRVSDKLGDLGIVGVCILAYSSGLASIDTFLMSCRALGRGVEQKFLTDALHVARARGAVSVRAEYVKTAKNQLSEPFLPANGFNETHSSTDADVRVFERELNTLSPRECGHFAAITSPLGEVFST